MRKTLIYIAFILLSLSSWGQDNHYSLFHLRSGGLNPALTGLNQEDAEARTLYRTQWNGVSPITYISLEAEKQEGLWGFGLNWNKNGAGTGSLISNQILLGASRQVDISKEGFIRLGFQLGYYQHSLDWENAVFESQYNPNGTNGLDNGETLTLGKVSSMDLNTGLLFQQNAGINTLQIGGAISHLTQDRMTLLEGGNEHLRIKKTLHSSLRIPQENDWSIIPSILFQKQGTASESILAVRAEKRLDANKSITVGAGVRIKDSFILSTEFKLDNLKIALAYDATISKMRNIGGGFGGFELGLSFSFSPPKDYSETVNHRMLDSDNDGIADESDHCPELPGNAANKGCPGRADSDGDGIVDEVDLCPGLAGSSIHGGCPDSDGDGVADIDDECPTIYGALHFQGCPDSDQDGISDKYDACPVTFGLITNKGCPSTEQVFATQNLGEYKVQRITETSTPTTNHKHSYKANDHSQNQQTEKPVQEDPFATLITPQMYIPPVEQPSEAQEFLSSGEILDNFMIFFDKDESMLDFLDKKRLRDFAMSLGNDTEVKLVLKGHTDEDGDDMYNMELGYRRSEAVKRYLAQFGLTEEKILTLSYGEESPISVMRGEIEDAKNRRVEIMIVK